MYRVGFILLLVLFVSADEKNYTDFVNGLAKNITQPQFKNTAWNRLAYLTDTFGPRMWGSATLEKTIDWLQEQAKAQKFDNIHKEPVTNFTKWVRGKQQLTMIRPRPWSTKLDVIGLGGSVNGDVIAQVIVVESFEELQQRQSEVKGKIVCYNNKWVNYGTSVAYRVDGPSYAAKYGALASLVRSVASQSIYSVHTGYMQYNTNISDTKIPCAAITVQDAQMFSRMQKRGNNITVHLILQNTFVANSTSYNLIFEIKGSTFPDQIVLAGGHIDTWDTGSQTGANDDGGGFISVFEAFRMIKNYQIVPQRTLRFIAWSGEQSGSPRDGAAQYITAHKAEINKHVAAFQSDYGNTKLVGFGHQGTNQSEAIVKQLLESYMSILNATTYAPQVYTADIEDLYPLGVPILANIVNDTQDNYYYFKYHHSAGDTMSIINPDQLDSNVVGIAAFLYIIADLNQTLRNVTSDYNQIYHNNLKVQFINPEVQ